MDSDNLTTLGDDLLREARAAHSGRAARTVHGGREHALRQTVIALAAGNDLAEHDSPGEATLQVVSGRVRFRTSDGATWEGGEGDLLTIPGQRHSVAALQDAVLLLTAVTGTQPG